jgi:hypothetical protein
MINCQNYVPYLSEMIKRNKDILRWEVTLEVEPPEEKIIPTGVIADVEGIPLVD